MKHLLNRLTPPQVLTVGFLLIIFVGSCLLSLPMASKPGIQVSFLDALFTAVSATSITGLTVVDTFQTWTLFGQIILLIMIEIGALGFMTFAILLLTLTKQRIDLKSRLLVQEAMNLQKLSDVRLMLSYVFALSAIIQIVGALLLAIDFIPRFGWNKGIYYSIAHSISAFANAGFTFFDRPVTMFHDNAYVLVIWILLISAGSLGFLVWRDLMSFRKQRRLSLHTRLSLAVSAWLILFGFIGFMITEKALSRLNDLNIFDRIIDVWFLAVVPRTAGLEVVPLKDMSAAGLIILMILMFIGGTPGSTSGGIKTTTVGILWLQAMAALRGRDQVNFGDRRISQKNIIKAMMLAVLSTAFILTVALMLSMSETIPAGYGLEYIVFEVIAAFSTAGFSLGLTPDLTTFGKVTMMFVMFIGRVGLYTVMFSVLNIRTKTIHHEYPTEEIIIG